MKIYYIIDEYYRVFPCCDWTETGEHDPDWKIGEIDGNAYNEYGIPLWKEENDAIVRRTSEEIEADIDSLPFFEPSEMDRMQADIDFLSMENEYLEEQSDQARADIDYLLMLIEEE